MSHDKQDESYKVATAMVAFGGSFVRWLGEALHHADTENQRRIGNAFPEYWATYLALFEQHLAPSRFGSVEENHDRQPL